MALTTLWKVGPGEREGIKGLVLVRGGCQIWSFKGEGASNGD